MCETFTVRHAVAGGRAVAKVLRPELTANAAVAERLEREAQLLARIDHPNVVRLFDAGRLDERPFLIIEWAGELALDARMKKAGGAIGVRDAIWIFRSVLSALDRVHALDIVHRDLKPSNIFLPDARDGLVKLIDFGVARHAGSRALTRTGAILRDTRVHVARAGAGEARRRAERFCSRSPRRSTPRSPAARPSTPTRRWRC